MSDCQDGASVSQYTMGDMLPVCFGPFTTAKRSGDGGPDARESYTLVVSLQRRPLTDESETEKKIYNLKNA